MEYPSNFSDILIELENLSFLAMGYSSPNPPVACVITDLVGKVLAKGYTQKTGGNHAEREAYKNFALAFPNIQDIPHLLFVTLEPCSHYGKTPPCLDLVLQYKPKILFYGMTDPNPLVQKRDGLNELKNAGITTIQSPEISKISNAFISGFFSKIENKIPRIILKLALSKEGFFSDVNKSRIGLSNAKSNQITQMLRAKVDAVLVGPGTVKSDLPSLDFRKMHSIDSIDLPEASAFFDEKAIFSNILFRNILNKEVIKTHNDRINDYQPYRIFVISCNKIPNDEFFEKQSNLNISYKHKKSIFILLDFNIENLEHEMVYQRMFELTEKKPMIISNLHDLYKKLLQIFSELSLNTVLVEGGNLFYKMFDESFKKNDFIYLIHSNQSISKGIKPKLNLEIKKKCYEIKLDGDQWECYGE